jgi:predicted  nucleic acid-binding Zn-ribbon protein
MEAQYAREKVKLEEDQADLSQQLCKIDKEKVKLEEDLGRAKQEFENMQKSLLQEQESLQQKLGELGNMAVKELPVTVGMENMMLDEGDVERIVENITTCKSLQDEVANLKAQNDQANRELAEVKAQNDQANRELADSKAKQELAVEQLASGVEDFLLSPRALARATCPPND